MWLAEPMPRDVRQAVERVARAEDVQRIAVMPDVHLAESVCIGLVVATDRLVYPQAVGSDIGCGMAAAAFEVEATCVADAAVAQRVLREIGERVPVMRQRSLGGAAELVGDLDPNLLSDAGLMRAARREGRVEMGTLGRGNHFIELQADADDRLWLMVHSGSRVMGQAIAGHHRARAVRARGGLVHLDTASEAGQAYLNDMRWALRYAAANRRAMIEAVAGVLKEEIGAARDDASVVDASHNHVRGEVHGGRDLLVHRKGASPAAAGERGVIPGSMGTPSYHVVGRGCEEAMRSSSHGAGRAMSRGDAARTVSVRELERQVRGVHIDRRAIARLTDEAPSAYKDVHAVMRAQRELVRIERELRPVVNYKGQ
jgi:tRNA-splicing ligase RtcB